MNERLTKVRIKAKLHNISLSCAHAPTEEKNDAVKDAFYPNLEDLYNKGPAKCTRGFQRRMVLTNVRCSLQQRVPLWWTTSRGEGKRHALSDAGRESRKGVSVRKSRQSKMFQNRQASEVSFQVRSISLQGRKK